MPTKNGMGSHQQSNVMSDEWLTPPEIVRKLGPFDLDPCSPVNRPWTTAKKHYSKNDDGLLMPWHGMVWCNPPYNKHTAKWLEKCFNHGNCIALIFARTETEMFFDWVWERASAVFFLKGRIFFHRVDGSRADNNGGAPSVLVGYGNESMIRLLKSGIDGIYVPLCNRRIYADKN